MSKAFEVGKMYARAESGYDPQIVIKRTEKTIVCRNAYDKSGHKFRQNIHHDDDGTEFVYDAYVPLRYRDGTVCKASWEVME